MKKIFLWVVFIGLTVLGADIAQSALNWPPKVGELYPDIALVDQTGQQVRIQDFKGSVILIEYIGMNCPACQSFAGSDKYGAYENIDTQTGLKSIEEYFPQYTKGVSLSDKRLVYIQILLYSMTMGAPSQEDAQKWAEHFHLDRSKNQIVLAGTKEFLGQASYNLIPGFQLIDKKFILRWDATGHNPQHSLWNQLLPSVFKFLNE